MGERTKIEWCDATFSPWWGCSKVSAACANCYAEAVADRFRPEEGLWRGARHRTGNWRDPVRWDRKAKRDGTRPRVFCASMADVFEDHPSLPEWRADLWKLVEETPNLTWLLLTKRPQNIRVRVPPAWLAEWPSHVWVGTTVEDQERADERIPHLLRVPAPVRFLSCEPLLGPVKLDPLWMETGNPPLYSKRQAREINGWLGGIGWVIAGGESGPKARPSHPDWFRSLRDHCAASAVPFHFKQWGEWTPLALDVLSIARETMSVWPDGGRGYDTNPDSQNHVMRVGKAAAGRLLDGVQHDGVPDAR